MTLQDFIRANGLAMPIGRGRIWRLTHDTTQRDRKPQLSKETPAGLVPYLSHPNGWWRDTAQQLLVQRQDTSVVPAVKALMKTTTDWRVKLHVMGVLDGLGALDVETVQLALAAPSPEVRAWGIRWSEPWLAQDGHPLASTVLGLMNDPNWIVRRQLAASIGELPAQARLAPATTMIQRYGSDPMTVDAVVSGLHGLEQQVFSRLMQSASSAVVTDGVSMLAAAIAKGGNAEQVQTVLATAADGSRPDALRQAVLHGLDMGLPAAGGRGGGRGGRGGGAAGPVRLASEPAALTALAARDGALAEAASAVVAKLDWPGKPEPVVTTPPLTPEEEKRFAAGGELYRNLCVGCHQENGRGLDKVAPALVGSALLLGNPGIPTRIILGGKEGSVGLMPPLSVLSDDQIANVPDVRPARVGQCGIGGDAGVRAGNSGAHEHAQAAVDQRRIDGWTRWCRRGRPRGWRGGRTWRTVVVGQEDPV